ncbi:hypothetical protein FHS60_002122 [Alloprevotella rava]|uniref:Uncharacterized protein n=1 Tax=Alloprevotella rava TaxID=671218 RepID=A0A7W5ULE1_9BACT|nr:hypothetical protein [Alloprevotella rava]
MGKSHDNNLLTPIRFKKRSFMSFLNRIGVIRIFSGTIRMSVDRLITFVDSYNNSTRIHPSFLEK